MFYSKTTNSPGVQGWNNAPSFLYGIGNTDLCSVAAAEAHVEGSFQGDNL